MKRVLIVLGVLAALVLIGILMLVGGYNRLVGLDQTVDKQWAQVQNVYQRRADLIPNLVNTVAGAANFEKSTLNGYPHHAGAWVGQVSVDPQQGPR